jgi:glutathione synthase/RimK-type ligase-like ATP-grasp enzyme
MPRILEGVNARTGEGRVALATCAEVAGREEDDLRVIDALARRGIEAVHAAWDDPAVDWSSFHLVVVRSTWDYPPRHSAFLTWAESLPCVLNPAPILRWNTDKRYLAELAAAGLPVIPTRFLEASADFEPPPGPFVIKPAVGCGAMDAACYAPGDPAAQDHVRQLHDRGHTVLVQPYLPGIDAQGEVDVIFIGGVYSHSIRRRALLIEGRPAGEGQSLPLEVRPYKATP